MDPDNQRPRLRVAVVDGRGRRVARRGLAAWLATVAPVSARGSVTIALVSDARMRALNSTYRGKDYATDVLSFPNGGRSGSRDSRRGDHRDRSLGDIVIARGVARRQAHGARHSEADELKTLALHGLLHLLGYDHHRDRGRMERVERDLRRKGGLREGLIERSASQGR